jgi:hypothetical protein
MVEGKNEGKEHLRAPFAFPPSGQGPTCLKRKSDVREEL